jgi:hypothetical protein
MRYPVILEGGEGARPYQIGALESWGEAQALCNEYNAQRGESRYWLESRSFRRMRNAEGKLEAPWNF